VLRWRFFFLFSLGFCFGYGQVKGTGPPQQVRRSFYHSPLCRAWLAHVPRVVDQELDCSER